jgi:hypothetical protein
MNTACGRPSRSIVLTPSLFLDNSSVGLGHQMSCVMFFYLAGEPVACVPVLIDDDDKSSCQMNTTEPKRSLSGTIA